MNIKNVLVLYVFFFTLVNGQMFGEKKEDAFNLSLFGAEGVPQEDGIRLTTLFEKAPAQRAGIKEGGILIVEPPAEKKIVTTSSEGEKKKEEKPKFNMHGVSAETKKKEKMIFDFIKRVEEASESKTGKMVVKVKHGEITKEYTVKIPKYGKHSKECPKKCKRCKAMIQHSLKWLAKNQKGGLWDTDLGGVNGKIAVTSVCGLAFLAGGHYPKGRYSKEVKMAIKYVLRNAGKEDSPFGGMKKAGGANWNQVNWNLGYSALFLAECYKRTPTAEIRNKLVEISKAISKNQEASGGWAHGPGGPNGLGYVELEIMSNYVLAGLGLMERVKIPVNKKTIETGVSYIVECSSEEGGVGYSTGPGQKGHGDPGRTAGALLAFAKLGKQDHPFYPKMANYIFEHMKEVPNGHVSPVMHFTATAMACTQLEDKFMKKFMKFFQHELLASRRPDGSFASRPTEESSKMRSNTDMDLGPNWTTGSYLIILQLNQNYLKLLAGK